jgi:hypothetical protein
VICCYKSVSLLKYDRFQSPSIEDYLQGRSIVSIIKKDTEYLPACLTPDGLPDRAPAGHDRTKRGSLGFFLHRSITEPRSDRPSKKQGELASPTIAQGRRLFDLECILLEHFLDPLTPGWRLSGVGCCSSRPKRAYSFAPSLGCCLVGRALCIATPWSPIVA